MTTGRDLLCVWCGSFEMVRIVWLLFDWFGWDESRERLGAKRMEEKRETKGIQMVRTSKNRFQSSTYGSKFNVCQWVWHDWYGLPQCRLRIPNSAKNRYTYAICSLIIKILLTIHLAWRDTSVLSSSKIHPLELFDWCFTTNLWCGACWEWACLAQGVPWQVTNRRDENNNQWCDKWVGWLNIPLLMTVEPSPRFLVNYRSTKQSPISSALSITQKFVSLTIPNTPMSCHCHSSHPTHTSAKIILTCIITYHHSTYHLWQRLIGQEDDETNPG